MVRTFAAIDVGSFELELGIYEITDKGTVRSVDQVKHMIALGKDTYNTGKISYRLVEEMCQVLQDHEGISGEGIPGLCHQRHAGGKKQSDRIRAASGADRN